MITQRLNLSEREYKTKTSFRFEIIFIAIILFVYWTGLTFLLTLDQNMSNQDMKTKILLFLFGIVFACFPVALGASNRKALPPFITYDFFEKRKEKIIFTSIYSEEQFLIHTDTGKYILTFKKKDLISCETISNIDLQ